MIMTQSFNETYILGICPEEDFQEASSWYFFASHFVGVLSLLSGIYCSKLMSRGLSDSLGYFKSYLYVYHISSTVSAVFICCITTPVYYLPLYAGYNIGLMNYLNIPFPYQCNLTVVIHYTYFAVCIILFFYRYWLVRTSDPNFEDWKYRLSIGVISTFYTLPYFISSYTLASSDRKVDALVNACPAYRVLQKIQYSYNVGRIYNELSLQIEMLFFFINAITLMCFLIILKILITKCLSYQQPFMSQKSLSMHRKILRTLELQTVLPSMLLSCPSITIVIIMLTDWNITLDTSHILIFLTQLHGLANTAGIIVLNNSLLELFLQDVLRLLRIKKSVILLNSQVLPSQSTITGSKKFEATQTADAF